MFWFRASHEVLVNLTGENASGLDRARDLEPELETVLESCRVSTLRQVRAGAAASEIRFLDAFVEEVRLCDGVLKLFGNLSGLAPWPQWHEAIRLRVLPHLDQRSRWLHLETWQATQQAFETGNPTDDDCCQAACELYFDTWLYLAEVIDAPYDSPFLKTAELTCEHPHPHLRLVHCLRDLAYGDESRADDLVAMIQSPDPEMEEELRACFLID